jgi:hypothetical protein
LMAGIWWHSGFRCSELAESIRPPLINFTTSHISGTSHIDLVRPFIFTATKPSKNASPHGMVGLSPPASRKAADVRRRVAFCMRADA